MRFYRLLRGTGPALYPAMKALLALFILSFTLSSWASTPVGWYNEGSLIDGECMPVQGPGFEILKLTREVGHIFGTTELVKMLKSTAAEMSQRFPGKDRLQIEDLSAQFGGDIDPHGSHENGLDADIQFLKVDGKEFIPTNYDPYAPPMVENGVVDENFDVARNWELMKTLHRHGNVQLIFIDQSLKNALVRHARAIGEHSSNTKVINSLRHVENHQDHFHVRLNCPANANRCRSSNKP